MATIQQRAIFHPHVSYNGSAWISSKKSLEANSINSKKHIAWTCRMGKKTYFLPLGQLTKVRHKHARSLCILSIQVEGIKDVTPEVKEVAEQWSGPGLAKSRPLTVYHEIPGRIF